MARQHRGQTVRTPTPTSGVGYGDRTVDEMAHAWVNVTYFTDEDYEAEVERRAAARTDDN